MSNEAEGFLQAIIENPDDDLHRLIELAKGVHARNDPAEIASFLENRNCTIEEYIDMMTRKLRAPVTEAASQEMSITSWCRRVNPPGAGYDAGQGWRSLYRERCKGGIGTLSMIDARQLAAEIPDSLLVKVYLVSSGGRVAGGGRGKTFWDVIVPPKPEVLYAPDRPPAD